MINWKMKIDISDIWYKYTDKEEQTSLESFIDELVLLLDSRSSEIGDKFGEDAQMQYEDILFNIQHNVEDDEEFEYYMNELYDWADDYKVWIETS